MNKFRFTMALQVLIIVGIFAIIILIAYKKQDKGYISFSREVRSACEKYMSNRKDKIKINDSFVIYMKDLLDEELIKENKKEYCVYSVIYTKGIFFDKYKANKDCNIKEENTTEENKTDENVTEENKSIEE